MMNKEKFYWDCVKGTREIKQKIEKEMEGMSVVEYLARKRQNPESFLYSHLQQQKV